MNYWSDLFTPETYVGVRAIRSNCLWLSRISANDGGIRICPGDKFICYLVRVSRWVGVFEVLEGPGMSIAGQYFLPDDDPFIVRFKVNPARCGCRSTRRFRSTRSTCILA